MKVFILLSFVLFDNISSISQEFVNGDLREHIVFYNVENLFDVYNDSLTNDDEFTPEGLKKWNNHRFYSKLNNIYKVIINLGEWNPPAIVGICEIENSFTLNKLIYETPLHKFDYRSIHFESPDKRGVDVALIYRDNKFTPLYFSPIRILFPFDTSARTRDILYVKGIFLGTDTIHLYVNHWTSRYGGYMETKPKREYIAGVLRGHADSIYLRNNDAKIVIMGDFNDEPFERSLQLLVKEKSAHKSELKLINLMDKYSEYDHIGTVKYQGVWTIFDQIIVSENLLDINSGYFIHSDKGQIFKPEFLTEDDEKYLGQKPFRTYNGPRYLGGFSDHFPVFIELLIDK